MLNNLKVAIVHEWLVDYSGSERVLEQMLQVFPKADLFGLVDFVPDSQRHYLAGKSVRTSFIQGLPGAKRNYRNYLPLMPLAVEQFDLSSYDLVISSSHAVAKGVITGPDQLHLCMCYSPIRYAWDLQHQYLRESKLERGVKAWVVRWLLHRIRLWDYRTANGVDAFMAISKFIARRIWKVYRRESTVIYPPVDTTAFELKEDKEEFYLTASRLVPYKKIDLIVEAFAGMPEKRLVVIGDGPDAEKIKQKATSNIQLLGYQPFSVLKDHMQRTKAFVFAAEEDFGIVPIEAQACGTPVIAYGKGGALETIVGLESESPTGVFFGEQSVASLQHAVQTFEQHLHRFDPQAIRQNALRFNIERFRHEFLAFVEEQWQIFTTSQKVT
jgi:glycosyltransferase involved in cell wall biosynthesis